MKELTEKVLEPVRDVLMETRNLISEEHQEIQKKKQKISSVVYSVGESEIVSWEKRNEAHTQKKSVMSRSVR